MRTSHLSLALPWLLASSGSLANESSASTSDRATLQKARLMAKTPLMARTPASGVSTVELLRDGAKAPREIANYGFELTVEEEWEDPSTAKEKAEWEAAIPHFDTVVCIEKTIKHDLPYLAEEYLIYVLNYKPSSRWGTVKTVKYHPVGSEGNDEDITLTKSGGALMVETESNRVRASNVKSSTKPQFNTRGRNLASEKATVSISNHSSTRTLQNSIKSKQKRKDNNNRNKHEPQSLRKFKSNYQIEARCRWCDPNNMTKQKKRVKDFEQKMNNFLAGEIKRNCPVTDAVGHRFWFIEK